MAADQGLVHKLILAVVALFMVSAECASLHSEELQFSPNAPATVSSQFNQAEKSTATGDLGESAATNHMKSLRDAPSMSGSTNRRDQLRLGNSYLGIQTEKGIPVIESFKRGDCTTDDECADYSGLPKSQPATRSLKNLRKPFLGLSITRPLQR
jgi:hypothetical protein